MKLSELVRYLNHLEQNVLSTTIDDTVSQAEFTLRSVIGHEHSLDSFSNDLKEDFDKIKDGVVQFNKTIDALKQHLNTLIAEQEPELYAQSQQLYEVDMAFETNEHILNRKINTNKESREILDSKIKVHASWRWPGMLIRPGLESFIEDLVPLDPLYIVDQNEELLKNAIEKFEPAYQRRLRRYVIDDRQEGKILSRLPDGQFGFVFVNMFFNFKPLDLINRYLDELYEKIRPGGILIFTYNECDSWQGVDLAERNFMCYTPGKRIRAHAESVGFVIEKNITDPANAAWFEMRKPGDIDGIRAGQSLAKIIPK